MSLEGGLDEVGWGSLAGPIISAVVVTQTNALSLPSGVKDSKQLSEASREMLYPQIILRAHDVGVGHAWPWEIDTLGPLTALQLSYDRALQDLRCSPELLIVDGDAKNRVATWEGEQRVEAKADVNYPVVSAASIIAKVFRDRLMTQLSRQHPQYLWDRNKGYGTQDHLGMIKKHGLLIDETNRDRYIHRKAYCKKQMYDHSKTFGR